jgi:acyl dehydratase
MNEWLDSLTGVEFAPRTYEIERGMVRKFAEAVGDHNPQWEEVAPSTILAALRHEEFFEKVIESGKLPPNGLNGGSDVEFYMPIKIGDVISVTAKLTRRRWLDGKLGRMLLLDAEITYTNQRGEKVARERSGIVKYW